MNNFNNRNFSQISLCLFSAFSSDLYTNSEIFCENMSKGYVKERFESSVSGGRSISAGKKSGEAFKDSRGNEYIKDEKGTIKRVNCV